MTKMAWAENAVIIKDNGMQVAYHPKCPNCGKVYENITSNVGVSGGTTYAGTFSCYKCGKAFSCRFGRN